MEKTHGDKTMRKEASIELWKELYDLAVQIKQMEPWKDLWDTDLVEIHLPGYEEPVYCSVMGKGGSCYGIGLYEGHSGLCDFDMVSRTSETGLPTTYVMGEQSNLTCYFGDRDEVSSKQKAIIKELGLKFRGKGQWIYFESYKKRYIPYLPDQREVKVLLDTYRVLPTVFKAVRNGDADADWDHGEIISYTYDESKKSWEMTAKKIPDCQKQYPYIQLTDDILKQKLKKQKKNQMEIVLDLNYLFCGVTDKKLDRPGNPQIMLAAEMSSGMLLDMHMMDIDEDEVDAILDFFIPFILEYGRVKTVYTRNPWVIATLSEICEICKIDLVAADVELMDEIFDDMRNSMF